jgi:hypothetical protein
MARLTIRNEEIREVLRLALWNVAVGHLGNNQDEMHWIDATPSEWEATRRKVDARVAGYHSAIEDMRTVEAAELGDSVSLIDSEIEKWALSFRNGLAENADVLLNADAAERERMLRLFDAAYELLPAEAVA